MTFGILKANFNKFLLVVCIMKPFKVTELAVFF